MRNLTTMLAGAIGGALIAVAAVLMMARSGYMPLNEGQLRGYLLHHPQLVAEMTDAAQRQEDAKAADTAAAAMKKIGIDAFFDPKFAYVTGPADAKKTLVEFYDYNCPYCRASLPAMMKYYQLHKADTRFSFIEFPIKGPASITAARAALAAREQPDKYMALHYILMNETDVLTDDMVYADAQKAGLDMVKLRHDMQAPEIEAAIDAGHTLAHKAGIDGTPTFILNGVMHPGALDEAALDDLMKKS